jgi:SSS family solute:Na+ symporter
VLASKDTKTGQQIYTRTSFFFVCRFLIPGIWGIAALAVIGKSTGSLEAMPTFLATFVPIGLMGLCIAAMLAADMSTDSSYMLTWASVIYNDILAPFRKGTWSEKKGLFWNRTIVALIGLFLLFYGLWYPLEGDVWTYLGITGTIYLASISVILIASCYWKRANSWGAFGSIFFAAFIPICYLVLEKTQPETAKQIGANASGIAAYVCSALAMFIGSTLKNLIAK